MNYQPIPFSEAVLRIEQEKPVVWRPSATKPEYSGKLPEAVYFSNLSAYEWAIPIEPLKEVVIYKYPDASFLGPLTVPPIPTVGVPSAFSGKTVRITFEEIDDEPSP